MDALEQLRRAISVVFPVGLERSLDPVTAYMILPLFGRFNRGVLMDSGDVKALADPVGLGLQFGLFIGKQVGYHSGELDRAPIRARGDAERRLLGPTPQLGDPSKC